MLDSRYAGNIGGSTAAVMVLLRISHPPAGATTLIISLGIISKPRELVINDKESAAARILGQKFATWPVEA